MLIELLEKLATPKSVGRYNKNPRQKIQMVENLGSVLRFIAKENIKLVNIGKQVLCILHSCPLLKVHSTRFSNFHKSATKFS